MKPKELPVILMLTLTSLESVIGFTAPASIKPYIPVTSKSIRSAAGDFFPPAADGRNSTGFLSYENPQDLNLAKDRNTFLTADDLLKVKSSVEDVEAILEVSQAAAEAAEASLPDYVADSIPLIPLTTNGTDGIAYKQETSKSEDTVSSEKIDSPSVKRIMTFATSATGVFLCSPLLSLIDTSAVGLLSGTAQQAALNPAVAVTDYAALLMAFLYTGATNLIAAAQQKDISDPEKSKTTASFSTALQLSGYVGAALGCFLFAFAPKLIRTLIGNDSINEEVFNAALKYVRIRALGMPAAAVIGSAQAGCLGMQDIKSPLYVLGAAAIINFLGDSLFVGLKYSWVGGAAGAAWATIFSQYSAVFFFIKWLCSKPRTQRNNIDISDAIMELTDDSNNTGKGRRRRFMTAMKSMGKTSPASRPARPLASTVASATQLLQTKEAPNKTKQQNSFTSRGLLAGKFKITDLFKLPNSERAKEYAPFVIPVTTTQVGRVSSYVAMSHVVSSTLGTAAMAAQQVIVSLFYCLTPITDSLSLTAQSIIPGIAERKISMGRAAALKQSVTNFFKAGGMYGGVLMSAVLCIPFLSRFFTSDPVVAALINSVVPHLLGIFAMDGVLMAAEGLLLGQKDLNYIGKMYGTFFFAVPYFMFRIKKAALAGIPGIKLTSVWSVFVTYQFARLAALVLRTLLVQKQSEAKAKAAEAEQEVLSVFE